MDMVEVRAALEGLNAKLAAQNIKSKDVDKLQKILVKGTKAIEKGDLDACKKLNSEFHNTLATIPGNTILRELVTSLRERTAIRSEEHTSELQSRGHLVCRLLLEKK